VRLILSTATKNDNDTFAVLFEKFGAVSVDLLSDPFEPLPIQEPARKPFSPVDEELPLFDLMKHS
jgi:hypothetical protein